MYGNLNLKIRNLNEHLICVLCNGYYVDATTIIECLHSFCRSCIVIYLATNKCCPKCEIPAHKTRPLLNIRSDKTLQDVVYKLVPELFEKERERKLKFHKDTGLPLDVVEETAISPKVSPQKNENRVSLCLENDNRNLALPESSNWTKEGNPFPKRYLRCFDAVTVGTINKLMRRKLSRDDLEIITFCRGEVLPEKYTLMDVSNTFSWKSDRPLNLTYMMFSSKHNRKRKINENMENEMVDDAAKAPPKKVFKEIESSTQKLETYGIDTKIPDVVPKTTVPLKLLRQPETYVTKSPSVATNIKYNVPKLKPISSSSVKSQNNSQNGGRNLSYSVMNVPLLQAVAAPYAEASTMKNAQMTPRTFAANGAQRRDGVNEIAVRNFQIPQNPGPERTKSINSIANRLQIQRQRQNEKLEPDPKRINRDELLRNTNQSSSNPLPPQSRSSRTDSETVAAMRRQHDQLKQKLAFRTLPTVQPRSHAQECARNAMGHGQSGNRNPVPNPRMINQRNASNIQPSPPHSNATKFIQLKHSRDLPNYDQATERQRYMQIMQQQQQQQHQQQQQNPRSKYQEIQPKISTHSRGQRIANAEDLKLLSTTRQLASLRQQQKLLNEIAAAVAGSRSTSSMRTNDSIRASVSSLSPRLTSPRMSSPIQPSTSKVASQHYGMSFSNPRPRLSIVSPPKNSQTNSNLARSNGSAIRPFRQIGGSFSEVTRPSNVCYSSLSTSLGGNIDIYHQNTIAKAKESLRKMDIINSGHIAHHAQIRTSTAPYIPIRPTTPRKIQPKLPTGRSSSYAPMRLQHVSIAPKPIPQTPPAKFTHSHPQYYNRHPMQPPKTFTPVSSSFSSRPSFRPSFPRQQKIPGRTPPSVPVSQPEQEQPLCLVVKK